MKIIMVLMLESFFCLEFVNKAKSNCAALGFDKDSPKFRNCVME